MSRSDRSPVGPPLAGSGPPASLPSEPGSRIRRGDQLLRFAEEVLGEDIDARVARIRTATNEAGFDPFGFDPETARYALAASAFMHRWYFRTEVFGIENLPPGRLLVISNHSGQVPLDGLVITTALMLDAEPPRLSRGMVEKWVQELPFFSSFFPRCGQVLGSPENARRLLANDETLVVFPEGSRGIAKTFDRRYQLESFGLGFMRQALEAKAPIVPVAVIGAEEQYPSLGNIRPLAKLLRMPSFPLIPHVAVGLPLPLPVRYRLHFGEPMWFEGDPDDEDAEISQMVRQVRGAIEDLIDQGRKRRRSIFF